jgi:CO dehydrogenase maturation factor
MITENLPENPGKEHINKNIRIMKISVCGKGGSGKSVIVTLLANEINRRGYQSLVVDSDESNSGLYQMLGFDQPPIALMEMVGGKKGLKRRMSEENVLDQEKISVEEIPSEYILAKDNLKLVAIGKILQFLEGCACPMGVLSREFLKKLSLKEKEIAIVDMEAGIEHFGRGIEEGIDSVLVVVEPSRESIVLAEKIKDLAKGAGVNNIWAILNKITSEDLILELKNILQKKIEIIGTIHYQPAIFEACLEGQPLDKLRGGEIREIVDFLLSKFKSGGSKCA